MKINGVELSDSIEESKNYINKIPLETNKGTKAVKRKFHRKQALIRNDFIVSEIKKYTEYQEILLSNINMRIEKLMPISHNQEFEQQEKCINKLLKLSVLENNYSHKIYFYNIIKNILELTQYGKDNIDNMNLKLKNIIDYFTAVGIKVDINLFHYSNATLEYMKKFLEEIKNDDFYKNMRLTFESLYFENPQIINHLKLNLLLIVSHYQKKIIEFNLNDLNKNKLELNSNNLYEDYCNKSKELILKINTDSYHILDSFLNDQLKVDDYFDYDNASNTYFSYLLKNTVFSTLNSEKKIDLYNQVLKLKSSIKELKEYFYFKPMISDLLKIYKNNTEIVKKYNEKQKEIEDNLKIRTKLFHTYQKLCKPNLLGKVNQSKIDKAKLLLNQKINELSKLYDELNQIEINYLIFNHINDSSSVKNLLLQATYSYPYLRSIYDNLYNNEEEPIEFEEFESRLIKFIYNHSNTFIDKCPITVENIESVVAEKYRLFDLNINASDLELDSIQKLETTVDSIVNLYYLIEAKIDMRDIKFIYLGKHI